MQLVIDKIKVGKSIGIKVVDTKTWEVSVLSIQDFTHKIRNGKKFDNLYLCVKRTSYANIVHLLSRRQYKEFGSSILIPCSALSKSIFNRCKSFKISDTIKTAKVDECLSTLTFYYDTNFGLDLEVFNIKNGNNYSVKGLYNKDGHYCVDVECLGYYYRFEFCPERFKINNTPYGGIQKKTYLAGSVDFIYVMPNSGLKIKVTLEDEAGEDTVFYVCTDICTGRISNTGDSIYADIMGVEI